MEVLQQSIAVFPPPMTPTCLPEKSYCCFVISIFLRKSVYYIDFFCITAHGSSTAIHRSIPTTNDTHMFTGKIILLLCHFHIPEKIYTGKDIFRFIIFTADTCSHL